MSLEENIKNLFIEELKLINLNHLDDFARKYNGLINCLYSSNIVSDVEIESALEQVVIERARRDYKLLTSENTGIKYPDHILVPKYFAYGLEKNIFSKEEIGKMNCDHGENVEGFMRCYGEKNLLSKLRKELLDPKPPLKLNFDYDPHSSCY
jgi:hypothetical protein